jgi:hypothetical protein
VTVSQITLLQYRALALLFSGHGVALWVFSRLLVARRLLSSGHLASAQPRLGDLLPLALVSEFAVCC